MATRGFRVVQGAWRYAPEGGRVDASITARPMPSDSPDLDKLALRYGMPVAVIRQAFGTLPPSNPAPAQAPDNPLVAAESAPEEAAVAADAQVEEVAPEVAEKPKVEAKPKKQKKAKKATE